MSSCFEYIDRTYQVLMETSFDVFKNMTFANFFIQDKVNIANIQSFFPEFTNLTPNKEQEEVIQKMAVIVHDYTKCNFFEKIWWRFMNT